MSARRIRSQEIRRSAAELAFLRAHLPNSTNADESEHRSSTNALSYIANFTKGLEHDPARFDEVDPIVYRKLLRALATRNPEAFESLSLATAAIPESDRRKFVNPQAGLAFDLEGPDPQSLLVPAPPRLDGAEMAAEMAEVYWMALLRGSGQVR